MKNEKSLTLRAGFSGSAKSKPTGEQAFGSWSGGLLGVLKQQSEDLGTGLKTWLLKESGI
jgi:hypothetical protein